MVERAAARHLTELQLQLDVPARAEHPRAASANGAACAAGTRKGGGAARRGAHSRKSFSLGQRPMASPMTESMKQVKMRLDIEAADLGTCWYLRVCTRSS